MTASRRDVTASAPRSADALLAGPHGGNGEAVGRALAVDPATLLDLSASLNPLAPDVATLLAELPAGCVANYPDPADATDLFAAVLDVDAGRLLLTNGGAEAIALLAAAHPTGFVDDPAFSLYRRHLATADAPDGLRWRANPSSPLGVLAAPDASADVWDEAFWPLATGTWTRGDRGAWRIGSLTKVWACPGLRLGYVIAPTRDSLGPVADRQPRWSVNGVALALLPRLLALTDLGAWQRGIAALRADVADVWRARGFDVRDTSANWILVDGAGGLRLPLARSGVLVRDCSSFGLPGTVRVAVPDQTGIRQLAQALDRIGARVP